jgi:hypothetical protein
MTQKDHVTIDQVKRETDKVTNSSKHTDQIQDNAKYTIEWSQHAVLARESGTSCIRGADLVALLVTVR